MSKPVADVTPLGDGTFRVLYEDGTHALAYAVAAGPKTWVFIDGHTHVVEPAATRRASASHDAAALTAPMPAAVTQVHVAPGQHVDTGDLLVTLEAMKMELPVRAPFSGTVRAVNCRVGEMVQPGVPLIDVRETANPEAEPGTLNTNPEP